MKPLCWLLCLPLLGWGQIRFETLIGRENYYEEGYSLVPSGNGENVWITATLQPQGGTRGNWLIKVNEAGDSIYSVSPTPLGGKVTVMDEVLYFVVGNFPGNVYDTVRLFKTTPSGQVLAQREFAFSNCSHYVTDVKTSGKRLYISGFYDSIDCSVPVYKGFVIAVDSFLDIKKMYLLENEGLAIQVLSIEPLADETIRINGWKRTPTQNKVAWTSLADLNLTPYDYEEWASTSSQQNFGSVSIDENRKAFLLVSDSVRLVITNGNDETTFLLGKACGGDNFRITKTRDDHLLIHYYHNIGNSCVSSLVKYSYAGQKMWQKNYDAVIRQVYESAPGQFWMTGYAGYLPDVFVARFDTVVSTYVSAELELSSPRIHTIQNGIIITQYEQRTYRLKLFDLAGKEIKNVTSNSRSHFLSIHEVPVSVGVIQIITEKEIISERFIIPRY